jgi:hypothetical protein
MPAEVIRSIEQAERSRNRSMRESAPGIVVSLLLHLLVALSVVLLMMRTAHPPSSSPAIVPVDVVIRLAEQTQSPAARVKAPVPVPRTGGLHSEVQSSPRPFEGTAANKAKPVPLDDLDAKLRALARLRQPSKTLPALDNAPASDAAGPASQSGDASYSVRDYVRAQAERRWNLDFSKIGRRRFAIPIHVVMRADGTIVEADVVDKQRAAQDAVYRSVALSARNAILLSSPILFPAGQFSDNVEMTLVFNPRDMMR